MAFIFGSAFAMVVSSWQPIGNPDQVADHQPVVQATAEAPVSREPAFLANSNPAASLSPAAPSQANPSGLIPASFDQPQPNSTDPDAPALLPSDSAPADEMPAKASADEAPADEAQKPAVEITADEVSAVESPAVEPPADAIPADAVPAVEPPAVEPPAVEPPADKPPAVEPPADKPPADKPPAARDGAAQTETTDDLGLSWHDDYRQAMSAAVEQQRNMFILFCQPGSNATQQAFERQALADPKSREKLIRELVLLKLPSNAVITSGGKPLELLKHAAFAEMVNHPGMAIIDLAHPQAEYYGHVVSTFPFMTGKYYKRPILSVVLNLPPGTLTQRTMIYAVRVHPEAPASTQGQFHRVLADEANRQSHYQAAILVQGHQNWDSRVHRISTRSPISSPQEVVAESWPSENLVDACIDCVDSWRQSPGHWEAVRSRHPVFGFDIQRGRNGIWYATGIFGHR
jgi:hypothetical protein